MFNTVADRILFW